MTASTASLRQRLDYLARQVEPSSPHAADRLSDLGAAIEGGPTTDTWAAADIFKIVDPDTIAEQVRVQGRAEGWVSALEILRNALVFVPIAVTWFGIWVALESYALALQANPALADQSFLYLWQQGFEGRTWLTLSVIALIDGLLLGVIFLLTLLVLWHNNQKERESETIRDELAGVLADASLELTYRRNRHQGLLVDQFEHAAQGLLGELQQERLRVQDLANRKEKEVGDLSTVTRDFMAATQSMLAAVQSLHQAPLQLGRLISGLSTSFQNLTDQQKDQQQEFIAATRQTTSQTKLLSDANQSLSTDIQTIHTLFQQMLSHLQTITLELRSVSETLRDTELQRGQIASPVGTGGSFGLPSGEVAPDRAELLEQALADLPAYQTTQELRQALDNLTGTMHGIAAQQQEFLRSTRIVAAQLKQFSDAQQNTGLNVQHVGLTLQNIAGDLREAIEIMQTANTETTQAVRELNRTLPGIAQAHNRLLAALPQQHSPGGASEERTTRNLPTVEPDTEA